MKQYRLRFNLDNEMDRAAYEKLMEQTVDGSIRDFLYKLLEQEYQKQLIINTIQHDIKKYKEAVNGN